MNNAEISRNKVIEDLKNKNIQFELIGTNPPYKNRSSITNFRCKKCGAEKLASAHNIINNHDGCLKCGKKKKRSYSEFVELVESRGYTLLSSPDEIRGVKTDVNTNVVGRFKHFCGYIFTMKINKFLRAGNHCKKCCTKKKKSDSDFLIDLEKKYGKRFFLSNGDHYTGRHNKITLTCYVCGNKTTDFAYNFITNGRGCSFCAMSKVEQMIFSKYRNSIEKNVTFNDMCITHKKLSFDFKLNGIYLECDGEQHFIPIKHFGGEDRFKRQQLLDTTKNKYALTHNLTLIRVPSEEITLNNIENIFDSSTTTEFFEQTFNNILYIKNGSILLIKGKYYVQK